MSTFSLLVIAKNEAQTIERTIDSVFNIVDEVCVSVDSKCTDKTLDICKDYAKKYPDKFRYREHVWKDSFAKARNEIIDFSKSDYYLFLDGHEYIPDKWIDVTTCEIVYPQKALAAIKEDLDSNKYDEINVAIYNQPWTGWVPKTIFA